MENLIEILSIISGIIIAFLAIFKGKAIWKYLTRKEELKSEEKLSQAEAIEDARKELRELLESQIDDLRKTIDQLRSHVDKKNITIEELRKDLFDAMITLAKYEERLVKHMAKSRKRKD